MCGLFICLIVYSSVYLPVGMSVHTKDSVPPGRHYLCPFSTPLCSHTPTRDPSARGPRSRTLCPEEGERELDDAVGDRRSRRAGVEERDHRNDRRQTRGTLI